MKKRQGKSSNAGKKNRKLKSCEEIWGENAGGKIRHNPLPLEPGTHKTEHSKKEILAASLGARWFKYRFGGETSAWGVAGRSVNDVGNNISRKWKTKKLTPMIRETDLPMLLSVIETKESSRGGSLLGHLPDEARAQAM